VYGVGLAEGIPGEDEGLWSDSVLWADLTVPIRVDQGQPGWIWARAGQSSGWCRVALDTTVLPVKVREGVFGEPVSVHLTLGLDVCTHSLVAFRLTLASDTSVDVAMLLRDVMMPLPMRPGWGPEMAWPCPGIPAAVVAEFAGYEVAGLPFFTPETVTTDHGSTYKAHALVEAQRVLGCNILPARTLRPQDKAACERAFGVIRSLLFEKLPGYTGVDELESQGRRRVRHRRPALHRVPERSGSFGRRPLLYAWVRRW
jgi:hypothetical protein